MDTNTKIKILNNHKHNAIKQAYGKYFDEYEDMINEWGTLTSTATLPLQMQKDLNIYRASATAWRPMILMDIVGNNGWTKIFDITVLKNLSKETAYTVIVNRVQIQNITFEEFESLLVRYDISEVTHYRIYFPIPDPVY